MKLRVLQIGMLAVLGACSPDVSTVSGANSTKPVESSAPGECVVGDADQKLEPPDGHPALLVAVRANDTPNPDEPALNCPRLVFEFEDEIPGYEVLYDDVAPAECGSGEPIDVAGADALLTVRMQPASGVDLTVDPYRVTYTGPKRIVPGGRMRWVQQTCDFEALNEWIVGLDARRDFEVTTLTEPGRVVVDISTS